MANEVVIKVSTQDNTAAGAATARQAMGKAADDIGKDLDTKLSSAGTRAGSNLADNAKKSASSGFSVMPALIAAGIAAGGPVISAAMTGIATVGLIGMGAVLQKGNTQVQSGWATLKSSALATGQQASEGLVQPMTHAMGTIASLLAGEEPRFHELFNGAAQDVPILTTALGQLVNNALPGVTAAVDNSRQVTQGLGTVMASVGTAVGGVFASVGASSKALAPDLAAIGTTVRNIGGIIAGVLPGMASSFGATINTVNGLLSVVKGLSPALGDVAGYVPLVVGDFKLFSGLSPVFSDVSGKLKNFASGLSETTRMSSALKSGVSGLAGVLGSGGALGIALGAVSFLFEQLGAQQQKQQTLQNDSVNSASTLAGALRDSGSAINGTVKATEAAYLQGQDWTKSLSDQGVSLKSMTDAALGSMPALRQVASGLKDQSFVNHDATDAFLVLLGTYPKAVKDNQELAAATGDATAATTTLTQKQLASAQALASISTHFQQVDQAVKTASASVVSADHAYTQAQDGVTQANRAVVSAQLGVTDAVNAYGQAQFAVTTAQQGYTQALLGEQTAQRSLIQARKDAQAELVSLRLQLNDQVTSEESAKVKLFDAQTAASKLGVHASNAQAAANQNVTASNEAQVNAAIALIQAQNGLADTLNNGKNLRVQVTSANAAGVNGSQQVVAAEQAVRQAHDQVTSAANQLQQSDYQLTKAQEGVQSADYQVEQAHRRVTDALYQQAQAAAAVQTANANLVTAQNNASRSLNLNTAAGQQNVSLILALDQALTNSERPTQRYNDLVKDTAQFFHGSTSKAQEYLKHLGLIPKNFRYSVTAVAGLDLSAINASVGKTFSAVSNFLGFASGGHFQGAGGPRDDANLVRVSSGEYIVNAAATAKNLPLLHAINSAPGFADGGQVTASVMQGSVLGAGYLANYNTAHAMGFPSGPALPTYMSPAIAAGVDAAGQFAYKASSGVGQWAPQILSALAMLGQSSSWLGTVERRMNQESGGNPTVVNKWDSNWVRGTPSVGLMQVIGPTFAHDAGRFVGTGPFEYGVSVNPLANIYAGLHYALGRYGSLSALNRPGGYATGGVVRSTGLAVVGEYGPELVPLTAGMSITPTANARQAIGQHSTGPLNITIEFGQNSDGAFASAFKMLARTGQIRLQANGVPVVVA